METIADKYRHFYNQRNPRNVYPVEFVVRAFLGNYPRHRTDASSYGGKYVLDLGFGDGRNMPLLSNLGMRVFGVEISQEICDQTEARMRALDISIETRVGSNKVIPFDDAFFDAVLACHSCYYVDAGSRFKENAMEIARVLKPGGTFVFSAPIGTSYIMRGARDIGDGHMEIANDPYKIRNGSILKKFDSAIEIETALSPMFEDFAIGSCCNDFWGIAENVWIVVCARTT